MQILNDLEVPNRLGQLIAEKLVELSKVQGVDKIIHYNVTL